MSMQDLAFPPTNGEKAEALARIRRSVGIKSGTTLAIDPGTECSGWCVYDGERVIDGGVADNDTLLLGLNDMAADRLAIEMVASYGMPVGREVFETVRWIGRFQQAWSVPSDVILVYRREVKLHLCNSAKAKDANIRQALLDKFPRTGGGQTPQVGTKKQPGPLYGVSSHAWAALAVAVYVSEVKQ